MTAKDRRRLLVEWLRERSEHRGLTTSDISDVSGLYTGHGRYDRARSDLLNLKADGEVVCIGRPSRWWA